MPPYSRNHELTAWGESRSVSAWAADARCSIDYVTILQRLERGWSPEDAIATPSLRRYELTAWGETKRLFEWVQDSRCRNHASNIATRIARGWPAEDAIARAPDGRLPRQLTLEGETKTIAAWARDPRCIPDANTLRRRLQLRSSIFAGSIPRYPAFSRLFPLLQTRNDRGPVVGSPHIRLDAWALRQGLEPRALRRRQAAAVGFELDDQQMGRTEQYEIWETGFTAPAVVRVVGSPSVPIGKIADLLKEFSF